MSCKERLMAYLQEQGVPCQCHDHRTAYTSEQMAAAEHIPGKQVAKAVIAFANDRMVMLVLPSTYMVDYSKAAKTLGADRFRLAEEQEFATAFPDCEIGAVPVFGNLYGLPVYVDESLTADESIAFPAGMHTESMTIKYGDFDRLVKPAVIELARPKVIFSA